MEYFLTSDWENVDSFIVYGLGKMAQDNLDYFIKRFHIPFIVDSDINKCNCLYEGIPVRHIDDVCTELKKHKLIIMTVERNALSIGKILKKQGLEEYKDYCSLECFVTEWNWRFKRKLFLMEIHTSITSRCTFNCRYCNMFMPYYKEPIDYTLDDIKRDLDLLFQSVDYLLSYKILGGEPLLNKDLPAILEYIAEVYGNKIGKVGIITNGSILPDKHLLEVCRRRKVNFSISDYSDMIPYKKRLQEVISELEKAEIRYSVNHSLRWCDFGFPEHRFKVKDNKIREHMLSCGPIFHGLNDKKFYYCHVAWSAEKCGIFQNTEDDCIDLEEINPKCMEQKQKILEHSRGRMQKGYINLCSVCGGCGSDNLNFVKAAEQVN